MASYNYQEIIKQAKSCTKNVNETYKLGISAKWAYYFAKSIITPKKDIKKISFDTAKNPNGTKISKQITKTDYVDMAKRVVSYIEKNKQMPNYVTFKDYKIRVRLYTLLFAKVLVEYSKSNKLPKQISINNNEFKNEKSKLYDYLIGTGCSGMGQCTGYYCACNSLQQSFHRLTGIKVDESTIAKWCGTTSSGTSHDGINTGVAQFNKKYGKNIKIEWHNFNELGSNDSKRWDKISEGLKKGAVFTHLLYRNKWGHYEPIKSVGDSLTILNSLGNSCGGGTYCGYIELRSKTEQKQYMSGISQKSVAILYNG